MNRVTAKKNSGLWALDAALSLLGLMVLLMVVRLMRFDDPHPLSNAWFYLMGVPTVLIATSMITRVLANDMVEKSIQIGFLFSVGLHLILVFFAVNIVLFSNNGPAAIQRIAVVAAPNKSKTQQYFQPTNPNSESRPDYLKPVQTEQNVVQSTLDPSQRPEESVKLNSDVAKDEIMPTLTEKPFNTPRKEASPSQPTISSTAERLGRPDLSKPLDRKQNSIDVPELTSAQPTPSQEVQAAKTDMNRVETPSRNNNSLAEMPETKLEVESRANKGFREGIRKSTKDRDEKTTNRELEHSLNRAATALLERPSSLQRGSRDTSEFDKPIVANVPVPKLGDPSAKTASDAPSERDTEMRARSSDSRASTRQSVDITNLQGVSKLEPSLGTASIAVGVDAWAAPFVDIPRKGLDPIKREIALPEIRDSDISLDRLRRPETGGPKIANSAVPIPAAAFSQRLKRNRDRVDSAADLGSLGPQTEQAIENGLLFLAKYQRADGSWHLEDFDEKVEIRSETAATALSLLSFQGAGYTHRQFKYVSVCERALAWMIKNQRPNGDLYVRTELKSDGNAWLYSHAIATLALCEAYGMTQDESIKQNAQRAIDFLVQSQDPQAGGWRYQPKIGSDTSVTGWCMMALKSAELSGLDVSKESYSGILKWLETSQASETQKYLYRYNWQAADSPTTRHGRLPTPVMTSVGLLMRLYLGWRRDHPEMQRGTDWLMERPPTEGTAQNPQRDTYYWYYATQVMFHMGGERWKAWYGSLYPMLIRTQEKGGDFVGSWEPIGRIPDAWGRFGGRLYVTTLNLLSLEVYYRHLPIYEATAD